MIIGAQGFTIRDYAQNEADFRETAKKLHDIGYKTLQVSAFGDIDPHIIREICDENGLSIIITHTNPQLILENTTTALNTRNLTASASSTTWRRRPTRQNGALFWTFIGRSTVGARHRYRLKKWRDALTSSTLRT